MKIWEHLDSELIFLGIALPEKRALLRFIAESFARKGVVYNAALLFDRLDERERTMSTGIGMGIGIPHASSPEAQHAAIQLVRLESPIEFESLDGGPVDIVLAIVVPEHETTLHLRLLAGISRLCRSKGFLDTMRAAGDAQGLLNEIKAVEETIAFH